jgi:hypothetical protein
VGIGCIDGVPDASICPVSWAISGTTVRKHARQPMVVVIRTEFLEIRRVMKSPFTGLVP